MWPWLALLLFVAVEEYLLWRYSHGGTLSQRFWRQPAWAKWIELPFFVLLFAHLWFRFLD